MKLSAWSLLLLCVMLAACDGTESPESTSLRPFSVGDQWIMDRTDDFDFRAAVIQRDTLRITDARVIDGEDWFLLSSTHGSPFGDAESGNPWLAVRDTGIWKRNIDDGVVGDPRQVLPFPLAVGEEWTSPSGLLYVRTAETEPFQTEEEGIIPAIPYRVVTTNAYRPFRTSTGENGDLEQKTIKDPLVLENRYSTDVGFVQMEGAWLTTGGPSEYVTVVGSWKLSLVRFIPAGSTE